MGVALLLLALCAADDPAFGGGFGGADDIAVDDVAADDIVEVERDDGLAPADDLGAATEFVGGNRSRTGVFPTTPAEPPAKKKTALELELEKARLDPALFPLIQLRVDVARLDADRIEAESRGLSAATAIKEVLAAAQAILVDVERIAMHRMNVCMTRQGKRAVVKNYKMTAAGPVRLSTQQLLAQTSNIDPDGCARIELIEKEVVARVRRAHELRAILKTTPFPFHKLDDKRALEKEQQALLKELAKEDVPIISLSGGADPYGR